MISTWNGPERRAAGARLSRKDCINDADSARHTAAQRGKCRHHRYGDQGTGYGIFDRGQAIFISQEIHEFRIHLYCYLLVNPSSQPTRTLSLRVRIRRAADFGNE